MVTYPISISRDGYRGANSNRKVKAQEFNLKASRLETIINQMLLEQADPFHVYTWGEIASKSGIPTETVREICYSIDCGSNGFTAIKKGMTFQDAMAASSVGHPNKSG